MTPELIEAIQKAGLNVVVTIGVFTLCVWIVKFIIIKMSATLDKIVDKMEKHNQGAIERGRYVKEEHEKMIYGLDCVTKKLEALNGRQ